MLSRAWLTIAQHVFQPALTGRPELISRKIVSGEPRTKAIAVSRFREKLSPANWVQGVTAISRKIFRLGSAGEPTICSHCYSVPYMKIPANNQVILT